MTLFCCCGGGQVAAWRCRGKVPLAVDVSASLAEASAQDSHVSQQACSVSRQRSCAASGPRLHEAVLDRALRVAYALPLIRWAACRMMHLINSAANAPLSLLTAGNAGS
jgi:hypothetical protein